MKITLKAKLMWASLDGPIYTFFKNQKEVFVETNELMGFYEVFDKRYQNKDYPSERLTGCRDKVVFLRMKSEGLLQTELGSLIDELAEEVSSGNLSKLEDLLEAFLGFCQSSAGV